MTTHTPGPWTVSADGAGRLLIDGKGGFVCNLDQPYSTERKANAALIAAAPELLVALDDSIFQLETLIKTQPKEYQAGNQIILRKARAAIAKARQT